MGVIRGILLVFVCVFLFLTLLIGNVFLTLNMSLSYTNVKAELGEVLNNALEGQSLQTIVENNFDLMEFYCQSNPELEYSFDYNDSGYTLNIPCSIISQGSSAVTTYVTTSFVDQFYYKDYDCDFWDCFETSPFFLISEKAKDYWNSKFYFALFASLILAGISFFLVDKKSNAFVILGSLLIVASLPFAKLDLVLSFFSDKFILGLLTIFFTESYNVFIISTILGILILGLGILLKLFKIGFKISDLFSKIGKIFAKGKSSKIIK